jgi:uncharacterized cupin superfamily protein
MNVVHTTDLPWAQALTRGRFQQRRKHLGGEKLACGLWELPPGKLSFPLHVHLVTEEALFVVSGRGVVRSTDGEVAIGPGDFVSFPAGGPAHQLRNDGDEPMVYLGMAAVSGVDVVEYPGSGKIAASIGAYPTGKRFMFRKDSQVDYLDGEPDAGPAGQG